MGYTFNSEDEFIKVNCVGLNDEVDVEVTNMAVPLKDT